VVDQQTGVIWLLMTWNRGDDEEGRIIARTSKDTRRPYVTCSRDDGQTWSPAKEITAQVKLADWNWYSTGPGNAIQLSRGPRQGRLVIPCCHSKTGAKGVYISHVIYSDDHGQSWRLGGSSPEDGVDECAVVELSDGRLMLNMRSSGEVPHCRRVCLSADGGATWSDQHPDETLVEPPCQASCVRYSWADACNSSRLMFSNPANGQHDQRNRMTVRLSYDEGRTWPVAKLLCTGPSAYSCLAELPGGSIGCLYEAGQKHPYEKIIFREFPLDWLTK